MSAIQPNYKAMIDQIGNMTVFELAEFTRDLQEALGVSGATAMPIAAVPGAAGGGAAAAVEEKTEFDVLITSLDPSAKKVEVIKAVAQVKQVKVMEAKALVDKVAEGAQVVLTGVNKQTAEEASQTLSKAGAKIELK